MAPGPSFILDRTLRSPRPAEPQHEGEHAEPAAPLIAAASLPWSLDPRRRRLYLQIVFGLASILVAVVVLWLIRDVLGAFVLGAAIAFLIQPGVHRLTELGIPRMAAIGLIFVGIILALAGLILLVVPLGVSEVGQLQAQAPALSAEAQKRINELQGSPVSIFGLNVDLTYTTQFLSSHLRDYLLGQFGNAVSIGVTALTTVLQILLMFIVAFLLALDAAAVRRVLRRLVPNDYRTDFDQIWRRIRRMLYAYVRGQVIIAGMIGILSGIACALLGLADPVALGLLAGITAIIPYLGPFLGAIPAILVALAISPLQALLIALAYFVISNLILNFVYPKVMGDAVKLPPLLVIVAFIAGFSWAGVLGMFVAVPIAATLRILFDHIYPRLYGKPA
ncbi:MAG: AI-2E family transporter [Chloroflexi bacterium]|nr:MAG: AI-2E family transporter [Chloroflexota bacterium]TME08451.1 MAG: AI-2E family transporter [Chloroflexota bacterium]